jgi:hypothetical protein
MLMHVLTVYLPFAAAGIILLLVLRSASHEEEKYDGYIIPWYDYVRLGLKIAAPAALAIAFALIGTSFALEGSFTAITKSTRGQELLFCGLFGVGLSVVALILRLLWAVPRRIFERIDDWRDERRAARA